MSEQLAEIYTDGSCHTQKRIGAWVAIILTGTEKKVLSGIVQDTTHNRMELYAVIKGIEYIKNNYPVYHNHQAFFRQPVCNGASRSRRKINGNGFLY